MQSQIILFFDYAESAKSCVGFTTGYWNNNYAMREFSLYHEDSDIVDKVINIANSVQSYWRSTVARGIFSGALLRPRMSNCHF